MTKEEIKFLMDKNLPKFMKILGPRKNYFLVGDKWIASCFMGRYMERIGSDYQDWFDQNILELTDGSQRPKCPICGKDRKFMDLTHGYRDTCGDKECIKKIHSIIWSEFYSNPDNVDKIKQRSESCAKTLTHEKRCEVQRKIKEKDPVAYSKQRSDNQKKAIEKNPDILRKRSEYKKMWWANKDNKESAKKKQKYKYDNDPSYKEKKSRSLKATLSKPGGKDKLIEAQARKWENPTERMLNPNYTNSHEKGSNYSGIRSKIYSVYEDKMISFDSNWERKWFINTSNNPDVVKIIRNPKPTIPYELNGVIHRYIPDFLIEYSNGYKELIEIKPSHLVDNPCNMAKAKAAKLYAWLHGIGYRIITNKSYPF